MINGTIPSQIAFKLLGVDENITTSLRQIRL
jgi:hypothetical protein